MFSKKQPCFSLLKPFNARTIGRSVKTTGIRHIIILVVRYSIILLLYCMQQTKLLPVCVLSLWCKLNLLLTSFYYVFFNTVKAV